MKFHLLSNARERAHKSVNGPLSCSPRELQKMIMETCGVEDSAEKRRFEDHALEMFYVDHIGR